MAAPTAMIADLVASPTGGHANYLPTVPAGVTSALSNQTRPVKTAGMWGPRAVAELRHLRGKPVNKCLTLGYMYDLRERAPRSDQGKKMFPITARRIRRARWRRGSDPTNQEPRRALLQLLKKREVSLVAEVSIVLSPTKLC